MTMRPPRAIAAHRRVEVHQVDLEAVYRHSQSSSSQLDRLEAGSSSKASSPRRAISWKAAAQPVRGCLAGRIIRESSWALISTSPRRPVCSRSGLGMRIPWELPMRTMRVFMAKALVCLQCSYSGGTWQPELSHVAFLPVRRRFLLDLLDEGLEVGTITA